jgi:hypothetical protein
MNSVKEKAYRCSVCSQVYMDKSFADKCCAPKYCEQCGKELPYRSYYIRCETCITKNRFDKAEKLTEWNGWIYKDGYGDNDGYFESVDELIEWVEDQDEEDEIVMPDWVFLCEEHNHTVDIDSAIEQALEEAYEDAEFDYLDELYAFMKQWNDKQNLKSYSPDYKKILLLKNDA